MNLIDRLISMFILVILIISGLGMIGPTLIALIHALVPLVLVVGIVVGLLRAVFFYTRGW